MKMVVFGASGRVGSTVVAGALAAGHSVMAFTRNATNIRLKHKNLRVGGGNVSDDMVVKEALHGQDVAVVALGAKDISKPHSVCSDGMRRIVAACRTQKVKRLVALGNLGLLPAADGALAGEVDLPPFLQFVFADQRTAYWELRGSGLDWVMVCPPFMPAGPATGKYRLAVEECLPKAQHINVGDVAALMLQEAVAPVHHQVRLAVAY